jgi:uncharacterized protein (UPF0216 family)
MTRMNPYQSGTFEHGLWEAWNRDFFRQPVHAQILEIEQQLREHIHNLTQLVQEMETGRLRRQIIECMLEIESRAEDLSDIAEHQFMGVVTRALPQESDSNELP